MTAPKIAEEVAQADFVRMCEAFRIDLDEGPMSEEERDELRSMRAELVKDIMACRIIVEADGRPTYHPAGCKPVTFNKPTGATMMALETHPAAKQIANTMAAMQDMTQTGAGSFSKMDARDVQRCMRLAKLFLADQ